MTTDSRPDVFFIGRSASLAQLLENRQLLPLDTLLEEHGSAITPAVGEELLGAHVYGGMTYAIPTLTDRAACLSFIYRKNIADTYIPDIASVETIDDLTAVLMRLMRSNEDIVPVSAYSFRTWDPLSDELGVLMDYGQSKQVVNLYDSEAYRDICRTIREWQINGLLIDEDYGRTSVNNFVRTPEFFGRLRNYHPALIPVDSIDAGEPMDFIPIGETYTHTGFTKNFAWGISAETEHPVESMKFLNLLYSDPNVVNLLIYGVEGVHYEVIDTEMGIIDFPAGVTVETSGYAQFRQYQHGNQFISYIWNGYPTDIWEQVQTFNRKAVRSVAYGFSYDPAPVSEQVNACLQVVSEYTAPLEAGVGDTDLLLTEFRAALKEAGIDLVTAEKQRQLDAWLAAKQMQ
jgi:putative aldouronate transport system substrate-binding protein